MTLQEIKLHRLHGHHLLEPAKPKTVLHDLCGVQSQFYSSALHALRIRSCHTNGIDSYNLIKSWTLRGTMHLFNSDDLPLFLHEGRNRQLRPCDTMESDSYICAERKAYFADIIMDAVDSGVCSRDDLKRHCFREGMTENEAKSIFNSWGGLLRALCECGKLCHVAQEKKSFRLCPDFTPMPEREARLELARRYFANYGPATVRDAAYFFGCTQAEIKSTLKELPVEIFEFQRKTYFYSNDCIHMPKSIPECIFLAGFDQLMLGYRKEENPFLPPEHLRGIFNLAGIVVPPVLLHGRVVGKWKQKGTTLTITSFENIEEKSLIEDSAHTLWPELRKIEII